MENITVFETSKDRNDVISNNRAYMEMQEMEMIVKLETGNGKWKWKWKHNFLAVVYSSKKKSCMLLVWVLGIPGLFPPQVFDQLQ